MAQNIYDKDGNKVGTIKSDQEKAADDNWSAVSTIVLVAVAIVIGLALLLGRPWLVAEEMDGFTEYWIWLQYLIVIVTIVVGRKIFVVNKVSLWGAIWRVALANIVAGTVGGAIAQLALCGYIDSQIVSDAFYSAYLAIIPTIIVAVLLYGERRKNKKNTTSTGT